MPADLVRQLNSWARKHAVPPNSVVCTAVAEYLLAQAASDARREHMAGFVLAAGDVLPAASTVPAADNVARHQVGLTAARAATGRPTPPLKIAVPVTIEDDPDVIPAAPDVIGQDTCWHLAAFRGPATPGEYGGATAPCLACGKENVWERDGAGVWGSKQAAVLQPD